MKREMELFVHRLQLLHIHGGPPTTVSHFFQAVAEVMRGVVAYKADTVVLSLHES